MAELAAEAGDQVNRPVGVIDIGSNSVRLVVYDRLTRAPTPIFNEKALCGLGRGMALTGLLPEDGVASAQAALSRFRVLCDIMHVGDLHVIATAAARVARNGSDFIKSASATLRAPVSVLTGAEEARLAALGVLSGVHKPDGIVGDLGGGSVEIIDVRGETAGEGVSLPLGGLALRDSSGRSAKKAVRIVEEAMAAAEPLLREHGRDLYAIGGTWRALSRLHMLQSGYPLNVLHGYTVPAGDMIDFCRMVQRTDLDALPAISHIASDRRPLLSYGAIVLETLLRLSKARRMIVSAAGVREGLLFQLLPASEKRADPLLVAVAELNRVRARSPRHGEELVDWCEHLIRTSPLTETPAEKRLRRAACLLADLSWRAHPDYRGEQSLNVIAHAALPGIDHYGRAFLALSAYYRHEGLAEIEADPRIREFMTTRSVERARVLGLAMRLAYLISAAMPGILPRTPLYCANRQLILKLPAELRALSSERLAGRLKQLGRLLGMEAQLQVG